MTNIQAKNIPYSSTKSFSKLVIDYIEEKESLTSFIQDFPSLKEIQLQIQRKGMQETNRDLLSKVLKKQYQHLGVSDKVLLQIESLNKETTFTICTAHQPNIFTGYLYFIYKIIHAINLAKVCKQQYPLYDFVPVYYIGSEDNDIEEIGTFNYASRTYTWQSNQKGACGRMSTKHLKEIFSEIKKTYNEEIEDENVLIRLFEKAYNGHNTLAEATRIIVNELFGVYGLLVIDGDDPELKSEFSNIILNELLERDSQNIVLETIDKLSVNYKLQANPREINLFYLMDELRERIEFSNGKWNVLNSNLSFTQSELEEEVNLHPERFSPNVILRPLYQETLLPNIAFIGGGGELAYWMELKSLFDYHKIVYPLIFLRNSVLWVESKTKERMQKLGFPILTFFQTEHDIFNQFISASEKIQPLNEIHEELNLLYNKIQKMGEDISPNLAKSMEAHVTKMRHIEKRINQKVRANLKKKEDDTRYQIYLVKEDFSPNGILQERYVNFLSLYKEIGKEMIKTLIEYQNPFGNEFLILNYTSRYRN